MWMLPLYLHVNKKSDYDDMMMMMKSVAGLPSDRPKMFAGQKRKFAGFVRQSGAAVFAKTVCRGYNNNRSIINNIYEHSFYYTRLLAV